MWERRRDEELDQYEQYLRRELPRVVRNRLQQVVPGYTEPFESEIRRRLVDVVRDSQAELFRSYRQNSQPDAETSHPDHNDSKLNWGRQGYPEYQEGSWSRFDLSAYLVPPPIV